MEGDMAKKMTMKGWEKSAMDRKMDKKSGAKEGSKKDKALDKKGLAAYNKSKGCK
jgi:hypothetical protein